jgi:hypothetical protein
VTPLGKDLDEEFGVAPPEKKIEPPSEYDAELEE